MNDQINVIVVNRGRKYLYLRYADPVTGQKIEKSSGTSSKREATKRAGEWQSEVNAGGAVSIRVVRWNHFVEDFLESEIRPQSVNYCIAVESTFSIVEDIMNPDKITRLTTAWLKRFKTTVQKQGKSPATVHKYLQHLKTALKWAQAQGYLKTMPTFPKSQRNAGKSKKLMKGRPVTGEEFERMEKACQHDSLKYLLRGLWLSGLRLGEALSLTWDQWADGIRVDIDEDSDVFLLIDGDNQKNGKAQQYPVVDDFAKFLLKTPESNRKGFVFDTTGPRGNISRRIDTVSHWIVAVGRKAGVKVDMRTPPKTKRKADDRPTEPVPVYASAHDLRRSFSERWSRIVEPMVLRDLMRHASVVTTEKYYVGINAKKTLKQLRVAKQRSEVTLEVTLDQNTPAEIDFASKTL